MYISLVCWEHIRGLIAPSLEPEEGSDRPSMGLLPLAEISGDRGLRPCRTPQQDDSDCKEQFSPKVEEEGWTLATVFLVAGLAKLRDERGARESVRAYGAPPPANRDGSRRNRTCNLELKRSAGSRPRRQTRAGLNALTPPR
jgi:hypothetical protein